MMHELDTMSAPFYISGLLDISAQHILKSVYCSAICFFRLCFGTKNNGIYPIICTVFPTSGSYKQLRTCSYTTIFTHQYPRCTLAR